MQSGLISLSELAARLAPALGAKKSTEVVTGAARAAGMMAPTLSVREALFILDVLAKVPGLVGTAARYARQRLDSNQPTDDPADSEQVASSRPKTPRSQARTEAPKEKAVAWSVVVQWLTPSLGEEKARDEVLASMDRLTVRVDAPLTQADALRVLEDLASSPGLVGVAARFVKARVILRSDRR